MTDTLKELQKELGAAQKTDQKQRGDFDKLKDQAVAILNDLDGLRQTISEYGSSVNDLKARVDEALEKGSTR